MSAELNAAVFQRRLRELLREADGPRENVGCVQCAGSSGLSRCTFCRNSKSLLRCHYCVDCSMCSDCTHCRDSQHLTNCQHCSSCESCSNCAYVIRSTRLVGCSYCFGCVGLSGCDFHILNHRYARADYFEVTRRLAQDRWRLVTRPEPHVLGSPPRASTLAGENGCAFDSGQTASAARDAD